LKDGGRKHLCQNGVYRVKTYSNPLISVIVPVYNVEKYLKRCITSIIEQTFSNIEILLVDDGSTDNSPFICDRFAEQDSRIKVIHKKWGGVLSARKAGVESAAGAYIIGVDGDDWIEKDRLEYLAKQISATAADMIYMSGYWRDTKGEKRKVDDLVVPNTYFGEEIRTEVFPLLQVVDQCFLSPIKGSLCMWAVKGELLKEKISLIDDKISMSEDHICVWFCLLDSAIVSITRHLSYHYTQHGASLSDSKDIREKERMKIWHHQLKNYIKQHHCSNEIMKVFAFLNTFIVLLADYELLLLEDAEYLFPYTKVKKESKIIIYGAGKFGRQIVYALNNREDYKIVLWVDQNENRKPILGYEINTVSTILQTEYDFIVIATVFETIALEMKERLLQMGISEGKIATMDPSVINEDYLNRVFEDR
jgi:glycosyltransferase involved in cell wall biosynthesis